MKNLTKRIRIQTDRTRQLHGWRKHFYLEWTPDQVGGVMAASVTLFGVSLVYLGTAL